jgi:hypothetical protein
MKLNLFEIIPRTVQKYEIIEKQKNYEVFL